MEISKLIKKTLCATCVCFTAISAGFMLILRVINIGDTAAVEADRVLFFFLFSLLFSIANAIKGISQLHSALRHILHYVICTFAFYACFLLPSQMRGSFMFTGLVLFTLGYLLVVGIIAIFTSRLRTNREKSAAYNSQFKKRK